MSSVQQGSNDERGSRRFKGERGSRRCWTPQEEDTLLTSLKELVALGWKSDNGFKTGYLPRLEEAMQRQFPGTDLKGAPHITSKLQTRKKNYNSLTLALVRTGTGFDGNHRIECTQEQWEAIVKADPNAKTMRYKSWPLFDAWKEIFGKERATGDAAEDVIDMATDLNREEDEGDKFADGDDVYRPNLDDIFVEDVGEASTANSKKEEDGGKRKGKKRKAQDLISSVAEMLSEIGRSTNEKLDTIATRMGYEFDMDEAKKESFTLLSEIKKLELDQKFDICEIFADKPERLLIFKGLPTLWEKEQYVERLLNQRHH